ncbi:MAG TPA: type IV toxin-antitoxin system AbiEi family antitoxin domain-containing protein [Plantibacter sp.]|uniref:type IV toxin-antitoxin system AbiEi family antitoxin domain-containing protein n=1 Tax=unclassified Plantibacter TaxID=2624265 RepID=UPI002B756ABA|nr:type IV toxin-antitoxin system AbiEi family antitoxin domain-containing protein [Plantibacter sp.]
METFDLDLLIRPNGLLLVRDARRIGAERLVSAAHRDGHLVRLRKGIYIPEPAWSALSPNGQYRARIEAAGIALRKEAVFSHYSAALLWGMHIAGSWPPEVHTLTVGDRGGRSAPGIIRHTTERPVGTRLCHGFRVTDPARTVIDIASVARLDDAVAVADAALRLRLADPAAMQAISQGASRRRGAAQVRFTANLATPLAANGGESKMRVTLIQLGFPPPILQHAFFDADGLIGNADAAWLDERIILEFDGLQKYVREEFTGGRAVADIVIAEKVREDRLRALGYTVVRATWDDLLHPARLAAKLERAGLRRAVR